MTEHNLISTFGVQAAKMQTHFPVLPWESSFWFRFCCKIGGKLHAKKLNIILTDYNT